MKAHYPTALKGHTLLKAAAVVTLVMVWILIDKGNALGQSAMQTRQMVTDVPTTAQSTAPLFRDGSRDGELGDDGDDSEGDFNVYPNPVKDDAVFDFEFTVKTDMPYEICDALGRLIDQGVFVPDIKSQKIDFSRYRTGMYLVRVQMGNRAIVKRIIKQ
ncbi:MAG: T9SS type A sorting domain-containing protein [Flavobacteriales bacterium]|nr:T9SS type A sorting domain-containing protein [Flavobacteriales bacterium]